MRVVTNTNSPAPATAAACCGLNLGVNPELLLGIAPGFLLTPAAIFGSLGRGGMGGGGPRSLFLAAKAAALETGIGIGI